MLVRGASLTLRRATQDDAVLLLAWRNDDVTRAASRSNAPVTLAEHAAWLGVALADPARHLYVAEVAGLPVGTGRLDVLTDASAEVSVTVAPDARGLGYGPAIIDALCRAAEALGIPHVIAVILAGNTPSLRAFLRAGFTTSAPVLLGRATRGP